MNIRKRHFFCENCPSQAQFVLFTHDVPKYNSKAETTKPTVELAAVAELAQQYLPPPQQ